MSYSRFASRGWQKVTKIRSELASGRILVRLNHDLPPREMLVIETWNPDRARLRFDDETLRTIHSTPVNCVYIRYMINLSLQIGEEAIGCISWEKKNNEKIILAIISVEFIGAHNVSGYESELAEDYEFERTGEPGGRPQLDRKASSQLRRQRRISDARGARLSSPLRVEVDLGERADPRELFLPLPPSGLAQPEAESLVRQEPRLVKRRVLQPPPGFEHLAQPKTEAESQFSAAVRQPVTDAKCQPLGNQPGVLGTEVKSQQPTILQQSVADAECQQPNNQLQPMERQVVEVEEELKGLIAMSSSGVDSWFVKNVGQTPIKMAKGFIIRQFETSGELQKELKEIGIHFQKNLTADRQRAVRLYKEKDIAPDGQLFKGAELVAASPMTGRAQRLIDLARSVLQQAIVPDHIKKLLFLQPHMGAFLVVGTYGPNVYPADEQEYTSTYDYTVRFALYGGDTHIIFDPNPKLEGVQLKLEMKQGNTLMSQRVMKQYTDSCDTARVDAIVRFVERGRVGVLSNPGQRCHYQGGLTLLKYGNTFRQHEPAKSGLYKGMTFGKDYQMKDLIELAGAVMEKKIREKKAARVKIQTPSITVTSIATRSESSAAGLRRLANAPPAKP